MTRLGPAPTTTRPITRREPAPPLVDPVAAAIPVATAYVEVRAGRRPPSQLREVLTPSAYRRVQHVVKRRRHLRQSGGGTSVSRVTSCRPAPGAVEVVVVVRDGTRVDPVAVRLDRRRGQWGITDIALPEDRHPLGRRRWAVRPRGTS